MKFINIKFTEIFRFLSLNISGDAGVLKASLTARIDSEENSEQGLFCALIEHLYSLLLAISSSINFSLKNISFFSEINKNIIKIRKEVI